MNLKEIRQTVKSHLHIPHPKDFRLLMLSVVIAIACWTYIAVRISNTIEKTFTDISLISDTTGTLAGANGLVLLTEEEKLPKVVVKIKGERTEIGAVNKNDICAFIDFDSAKDQTGSQTLKIVIKDTNNKVIRGATPSPDSVTVNMDRFESKPVLVSCDGKECMPNISYGQNVNPDRVDVTPATVNVTGPSQLLSQVDYLRVTVPDNATLYESRSFNNCTQFELIGMDGTPITDESVKPDVTRFLVNVGVYYKQTLPVTIDIRDVPEGFDIASLRKRLRLIADDEYMLPDCGDKNLMITLKTTSAEKNSSLEDKKEFSITPAISLSELTLGSVGIPRTVTLKDGYEDESNLGTITVTLDNSDLVAETRRVRMKDIQITNMPPNFDCKVSDGFLTVTIIGTKEEVAQITSQEINATVNLYSREITHNMTFSEVVNFELKGKTTGVWISGTTKVDVTATAVDPDE